MDIFLHHFQREWRKDINNLDAKLTDLNQICRICFSRDNISTIHEMMYEDITMVNIIKSCLPIELDTVEILPNQLCSGCTNQLVHFYTFRENCKVSEKALLIIKEKSIEFIENVKLEQNAFSLENGSAGSGYESIDTSDIKVNRKRKIKSASKRRNLLTRKLGKKKKKFSKKRVDDQNSILEINELVNDEKRDVRIRGKTKNSGEFRTSSSSNIIQCIDCLSEFNTLFALRVHSKEIGHSIDGFKCMCIECGQIINGRRLLLHMRTHTKEKPYICDQCPMAFTENDYLHRHKMIHSEDNKFACTYCDFACNEKLSLGTHMRKLHMNEKGTRKYVPKYKEEYKCKECGRDFKSMYFFNCHLEKHKQLQHKINSMTLSNVVNNSNSSIDESDLTTVKSCDITTESNIDSSSETVFSCEICGRNFTTEIILKQHQMRHEKNVLCTECGRVFATMLQLKNHTKVHTREKPHKCKECGKQFSHKQNLIDHVNLHFGIKPHRCDVCGKHFNKTAHLASHLLSHTGEKPHKCGQCDRSFSLKCNLTCHMRTHTGEKPYKCDVCGRGFCNSNTRARHVKIHAKVKIKKVKKPRRKVVKVVAAVGVAEVTSEEIHGDKVDSVSGESEELTKLQIIDEFLS